jgi:CRP/FNR family transcriptional regulator, cyclic AMP receptor protein
VRTGVLFVAVEWRLLKDVPAQQVRELLQISRRRRFARSEVVFHRDDPGDSLHLISKGRFAIQVMTPLGEPATIAVRGPGESFGEMALIGGARRSATVAALEESETFSIYQPDFERLRRHHPAVGDVLVRFLVSEVRMLNERLLEALYVPVERRVLRRLAELAELYPGADGIPEITLTQEAISELAGAARPTVNKVLREEAERGTIELMRGKTRILDLDDLRKRGR